ncbi:MAG: FAD-binding oxidoreductase [Candidatus Binataceae bacterium]|jgi:FAD/FMN-containing dehydrogenase
MARHLNQSVIRKLAHSFDGDLILPDDRRYRGARLVWNRAVKKSPLLIARCGGRHDVVRAVEFARHHDLPLAVRAGGHSFAGHGTCDDGIVIDLSLMKRAQIAPDLAAIRIEGGMLARELDGMTQAFKAAVPLGSCQSVGVAGYALGGGESSLTPKFGYACDSINQVEIVTADGKVLTAREDEHPDLFWAVRGAGANFGVAVAIEFRLHPIEKVLSGHLKYPIRQARKVLAFIKEYAAGIPDDLFLILAVLPNPGERMLDIGVVWPGKPESGEKALRPLRTFIKPFQDTIAVRDYLDEQRAGSDTPEGADYFSSCRRAGHLQNLSDEVIQTIIEHTSNSPSEESGITMIYWHGPWSSKPFDNAFGFRRTGYEYWIHSYWKAAKQRVKALSWVREFFTSMTAYSSGAVYINGLENEGEERVRAASSDKYQRLQAIKRKYDPDNIFRINQNIVPAGIT